MDCGRLTIPIVGGNEYDQAAKCQTKPLAFDGYLIWKAELYVWVTVHDASRTPTLGLSMRSCVFPVYIMAPSRVLVEISAYLAHVSTVLLYVYARQTRLELLLWRLTVHANPY
jgi:hypothetical protein